MILRGYGEFQSNNSCFYRLLLKNISKLPDKWERRILFCGVNAKYIEDSEQKSAKAAEELFDYAMHERFSAVSFILIKDYRQAPVKFNADVKFYLQMMIKKTGLRVTIHM